MFIVWGSHTFKKVMAATGPYTCMNCNNGSLFQVLRTMTWFTLFWIPIFPYSTKYFHVCPICGQAAKITKQQAQELIAQAQAQNIPTQSTVVQ